MKDLEGLRILMVSLRGLFLGRSNLKEGIVLKREVLWQLDNQAAMDKILIHWPWIVEMFRSSGISTGVL